MAGLDPFNILNIAIIGVVAFLATILLFEVFSRLKATKAKKLKEVSSEGEKKPSNRQSDLDRMREVMLNPESEDIRLETMKAYIERPAQRLLRSLLDKGVETEVIPEYDPTAGFRYKDVEAAFERNIQYAETENYLDRLNSLDILSKKFYETVSSCPMCGSSTLTFHYRCSKCNSHHVTKTGLSEHIPCGYIGEREDFYRKGPNSICPKCGAQISNEKETRDMGLWYTCRNCGEKFEQPQIDIACQKCGNQFPIRTANIREISKYSLNPAKEQEIRQNVTSLEVIERLLTEQGFNVETATIATGTRSGIQHNFSLTATKEIQGLKRIIAVDHAVANNEVGAPPVILFTFKISEVKVDLPIFIAIPKLSEMARKIAQGYGVLVIEGIPKQKEELKQLSDKIQKRFGEEAPPLIEQEVSNEQKVARAKPTGTN